MKKYIIFALSFIILFPVFQVSFGWLLTLLYTPDINNAWDMRGNLSQEIVITSSQSSSLPTLLIAFLSATIAYFIPKIVIQNKDK